MGLRIVFVSRPGTLLRFSQVLPKLPESGHAVHLALTGEPDPGPRALVEALAAEHSTVTYGPAPERSELDGWRYAAWLVRGTVDVARYSHPRYPAGSALRKRMKKRVLGRLSEAGELEPIGRRVALRAARRALSTRDSGYWRRVIRAGAALEDAIPTSGRIDDFLRAQAPDVVLVTGVLEEASEEVEFVKSAARLGIPSGVCVASWDLLTNKGLLKCRPDRVFVWNENQVREIEEMHGLPADRVRATGAHAFDEWFARTPSTTGAAFRERLGLPPDSPYLVYLSSSPDITKRSEPAFVARWIEAIRASEDEIVRSCPIVIRPYPKALSDWRKFDAARFENVILFPDVEVVAPADEARRDFYDTLAHCTAVVGANTTAMIEANIVGKAVLSVLVDDFAQKETLHFPYLQIENGGFLQIAPTLETHLEQLGRILRDPIESADIRLRFLESFVRPAGIDHPAAPVLVEEVEKLAALRVNPARRSRNPAARTAVALEAALSAGHAWRRARRRGLEGRSQPVGDAVELGVGEPRV